MLDLFYNSFLVTVIGNIVSIQWVQNVKLETNIFCNSQNADFICENVASNTEVKYSSHLPPPPPPPMNHGISYIHYP